MFESKKFSFNVAGENALFTDPISRVSGEAMTYSVPTYSALRGIVSAIYWKPTLQWVIDRVRVLNPIQTETKSLLYPRISEGKETGDRGFATYLRDISYNIEAHYIWNPDRPDLDCDRNPAKHDAMFRTALERGGRRTIFLGKKEGNCYGTVTPCDFMDGVGVFDHTGEINFGPMLHGISFPDGGRQEMQVRFFNAVMRNGIIEFPKPEDCQKELVRTIRKGQTVAKQYQFGVNLTPCEEEVKNL